MSIQVKHPMYVVMFVNGDTVDGRNTSIVGITTTKEEAKKLLTPKIKGLFDPDAPVVEEDEDEGSYFLIQKFNQTLKKCWS